MEDRQTALAFHQEGVAKDSLMENFFRLCCSTERGKS